MGDLKVMMRVSLYCLQVLPDRALRMLSLLLERVISDWICGVKVRWVSKVTPSMRGERLRGRMLFWRVMLGFRLD